MNDESQDISEHEVSSKDYLWDRSGEADPEIARLEQMLAPFKHQHPSQHRRLPLVRYLWFAGAIAAIIAVAAALWRVPQRGPTGPAWNVTSLAGRPSIGSSSVNGSSSLAIGETLETDSHSEATIAVANIGHVTVKPNSRLRLVNTRTDEHRLALDRGEIHALIYAPPRLFFVDTKSATAVDYGCEYSLSADEAGNGVLAVNRGVVKLERDGREVIVPTNTKCRTRAGVGPGTPYAENASTELQDALNAFDFNHGGLESLRAVLKAATILDTITLWNLLFSSDKQNRGEVFDRLVEFVPPPTGVNRDGIIALDQRMLDVWKPSVQSRW